MKAINLNIHGIKCDNPECDFKDMSVQFKDYPKWMNRLCPKCGANLLTKADLKSVKHLVWIAKIINFLFRRHNFNPNNMVVGHIKMNGTGNMKIDL